MFLGAKSSLETAKFQVFFSYMFVIFLSVSPFFFSFFFFFVSFFFVFVSFSIAFLFCFFCFFLLFLFLIGLLFLLGGVVVFPSPVGWCCSVSSFLGVVFLSFHVVLLGFFPLWVVLLLSFSCLVVLPSIPSFGRGCFFHVFCWVVLLGLFLLLVELLFSPLLLRGVACKKSKNQQIAKNDKK